MIKKSFLALFTCLIIGGLLMVGSTSAFKYTASGDSRIAFDNLNYVEKIDFGSKTINVNTTTCERDSINNLGYICELTGVSGNYDVNVTFRGSNNYIAYIRLDLSGNNIISMQNYDGIRIGSLYLSNNKNINLNGKSPNKITDLHTENCNLNAFNIGISSYSDNEYIHFENNKLTEISDEMMCSNYSLEFNGKTYGNSTKKIFLQDNPINFIKITDVGNSNTCNGYNIGFTNTTQYEFERFGYSYNTTSQLNYHYEILKNNVLVDGLNGETTATSKTFSQTSLAPGNYTFKVCYNEENDSSKPEHCDSVDFYVSYYLGIKFTNQTTVNDGGSIEPQDIIEFAREKYGDYPEEFIGYPDKFYIELIDTSSSNIIFSGRTSDISYPLTDATKGELENGKTYTFNVYILDTDGNRIQADANYIFKCDDSYSYTYCPYPDNYYTGPIYASRSFTVSIPEIPIPTIQIDRPNNQETESVTHFSWTPTIPNGNNFTNYKWSIKENNSEITGGTITNQAETSLSINNLINGTYTFYVELNYSRDGNSQDPVTDTAYTNGTKTFTVAKTYPSIQIIRPSDTETEDITHFSWIPTMTAGFTFINYKWTILGTNGTSYSSGGIITNFNDTGFSINDLNNGSYTFNVKLNWSNDGATGYAIDQNYSDNGGTKTFTINKGYPSISIVRPLNTENENITHFSWTPYIPEGYGYIFTNYERTILGTNGTSYSSGGIITNFNNTGFSINDLNNGSYTFSITLNYTKNGVAGSITDNENMSKEKSFTVAKISTLNITSPTSGSSVSNATTTFSWEGFTADTFNSYEYSVTGPNSYSYSNSTTNRNNTSFQLHNLRDGEYTFTVTMHYNDGSAKTKTDSVTFTVNASVGANLTITSPNKATYTGNYIKTVPINFTWIGGGSTLISGYTYKLINTITNEIKVQGSINKNADGSYSIPTSPLSLPSGTYRFEITMLDNEGNPIIPTVTYTFKVVIPPYLEILTPPAGQLNIKDVSFSRSGFAEFEDHYKYEVNRVDNQGNIISTIKTGNNISLATKSFSLQNLHNGKYTFSIELMDNSDHPIIKKEKTFRIPDDLDLILDISDGNSSVTTLKSKKGIFSWGGRSEDFASYSYSIQGTTFKNETYLYTGRSEGATTGSITLNDLSTGRYKFSVNMLNANGGIITGKHLDFTVSIPASLNITNPKNGSTITSSSTTLSRVGNGDIFRTGYSNDSRHYEYELLQVIASGYEQKAASPKTNANSFNYSSLQDGASYQLNVKLYSGTTLLARDSSTFSVSIPKKSSGGGGGGSSSKSHPTNDLSVSITNDEPVTNERVEVVVDISDKYTGKVDFTKMQYYSFDEEKRIDIPVTSKNYVSDYSDDAKLGYVKFDSSDDGEKNLSEFLMFSKPGNYRIHVEDKDGYKEYTEFYVGKGNKTQVTTTNEPEQDEDEYYIARSCKKYKIEYINDLGVYTSPNLKKDEYFINKDYFKRYIDSKNKQINGCPTNVGWISTTYKDNSNSSERYTAPNGKVYFINEQNGSYSSTQLDKELNGAKKFSTINNLKYFIRDRNPFINMSAPVK